MSKLISRQELLEEIISLKDDLEVMIQALNNIIFIDSKEDENGNLVYGDIAIYAESIIDELYGDEEDDKST